MNGHNQDAELFTDAMCLCSCERKKMQEKRFVVASLILIAVASALLNVSRRPSSLRMTDAKWFGVPAIALAPVSVPTSNRDPSQFPPEHLSACDFSGYKPTRISDWLPAGVLKSVKPAFPAQARLRGVDGTVNVAVLINRQGSVERVCSTGPKELRTAAEVAAVEFRFRRPTLNKGIDPFGYIQETLVFRFKIEKKTD